MSESGGGKAGTDWQDAALRCLDALYGFAMNLTHDPVEAEDLVQETYLQAMPHFSRLQPDSNLKAWLFTVLRNIWLKKRRHARAGPAFLSLEEGDAKQYVSELDDPQAQCFRIWEREEVRAALRALPVEFSEVIALRDFVGFSYKEMADILDCPVGTVMSRIARARAKLKKTLVSRQSSVVNVRNG